MNPTFRMALPLFLYILYGIKISEMKSLTSLQVLKTQDSLYGKVLVHEINCSTWNIWAWLILFVIMQFLHICSKTDSGQRTKGVKTGLTKITNISCAPKLKFCFQILSKMICSRCSYNFLSAQSPIQLTEY